MRKIHWDNVASCIFGWKCRNISGKISKDPNAVTCHECIWKINARGIQTRIKPRTYPVIGESEHD